MSYESFPQGYPVENCRRYMHFFAQVGGQPRPERNHNICLAIFILGWLVVLLSPIPSILLSLSLPTYLMATDVVSIACFGRFLPFLYLEMTCCIVHTGEIRTLSENVTIEKVI